MIICAAGDIHGAIDRLYEDVLAFEVALGVHFVWLLHVGDFGVWPDPNRIDGATKRHDGAGDFPAWCAERRQAPRKTLFIKGNHPYQCRAPNPNALHVMFLRDSPSKSAVAALDSHRSPPDEFAVLGREVFLYCPNGVGRSRLTTTWIDRALDTVSTIRNWNTVNALVDMCRELP